jgi:hypothetical protein
MLPPAKHSQYSFRHLDLRQLQVFGSLVAASPDCSSDRFPRTPFVFALVLLVVMFVLELVGVKIGFLKAFIEFCRVSANYPISSLKDRAKLVLNLDRSKDGCAIKLDTDLVKCKFSSANYYKIAGE